MIKGLVNLPCKKGLKELRTFSLKRQGSADVITVLQYFNDSYKEDEVSLITKTRMEKTRCSAYKLHQDKFPVSGGRNFLLEEKSFIGTTSPGAW